MNTLTPEQLDMIKRLQKKFQEVMGMFQVGDSVYHSAIKGIGYISQISLPDKYGNIYVDAFWPSHDSNSKDILPVAEKELIRVPKPIDWQNPERGLWGMINDQVRSEINAKMLSDGKLSYMLGKNWMIDEPFTALLKALCKQGKV